MSSSKSSLDGSDLKMFLFATKCNYCRELLQIFYKFFYKKFYLLSVTPISRRLYIFILGHFNRGNQTGCRDNNVVNRRIVAPLKTRWLNCRRRFYYFKKKNFKKNVCRRRFNRETANVTLPVEIIPVFVFSSQSKSAFPSGPRDFWRSIFSTLCYQTDQNRAKPPLNVSKAAIKKVKISFFLL